MFDAIAPRYDLLNTLLTFGMDRGWRKQAVAALELGKGASVLDVACGPGELCAVLAGAGLRPVGIDLSKGMLDHARTDAPLVHGDGLHLPFAAGSLDGAVSGFALRNVADLPTLWAELGRVVRPGGRIALLEVAEPEIKLLKAGHAVYFGKVVPRVGALLSDGAAYAYLPRSVAYLPAPEEMLEQLRGAGFDDVRRRLLSFGISQLITATRAR
ncbi:ubiquinone/menaquinone biosynthesis methyltransferase [Acidiferrimicrobium sp. IK]|nr:ubiquinone/menaquinone biosynthesis methyltransferase [Acidiferrimicrobium sp. IK]